MSSFAEAFKRRWHWLAASCLLAMQISLMALFMDASSPTYDEPAHLAGGLNNLRNFDFSINPESGVLIQDWAALPNLGIEFPSLERMAANRKGCYQNEIEPAIKRAGTDRTYNKSRCMIALLNVACGLLILHIASRAAGRLPGILAYGLYCSMPLFISNGALATADMGATFAALLCCYALWRLLRRISLGSLAFAGLSAAFLSMCKYSAALMAPAAMAMLAVRLLSAAPLHAKLPFLKSLAISGASKKTAASLAAFALTGLIAWCAIWAAYGFRYSQSPAGMPSFKSLPLRSLVDKGIACKTALAAMELRLLPEAYLYGFLYTNATVQRRFAFLNGDISMTGFKSFFPQAFLMKTPPGAVAAMAIGLAALLWSLRSPFGRKRAYQLSPYLAFAAIYLAFALNSKLNIGVRHLMPAIPAMILVAALGFRALLRAGAWKALPPLLLAWCVMEAAMASPSQLAYFSSLYGGPEKAYLHLVDSSLDWGQDLKNLKSSLTKAEVKVNGPEKVYFCYLGMINAKECGFDATILPFPMSGQFTSGRKDLEPGVYCISATALQGANLLYTKLDAFANRKELERLSKSFRNLQRLEREGSLEDLKKLIEPPGSTAIEDCYDYEMLRFELLRRMLVKKEPIGNAGHSILIFRVSEEELSAALGPLFSPPGQRP